MRFYYRILLWCFRDAWPVFIFIPIIACHLAFTQLPCFSDDFICPSNKQVNGFVVFIMQLIGGGIVFYTLNSNSKLFKGSSMLGLVKNWYKNRPWVNKTLEYDNAVIQTVSSTLDLRNSIDDNVETNDQKIAYLMRKVKLLDGDIREVNQKVEDNTKELISTREGMRQELQTEVGNISSVIEKFSVGGFKLQLFGAFLLLYGLVLSYATSA